MIRVSDMQKYSVPTIIWLQCLKANNYGLSNNDIKYKVIYSFTAEYNATLICVFHFCMLT